MKYISMLAFTGSDDETIDFALVPLFDKRLDYFKEMANKAKELKESHDVDELVVYCDNADFYKKSRDTSKLTKGLNDNKPAKLVELNESDINFKQPEETLTYGEMVFNETGITFSSTGKYSDNEYWASVPYEILFK